MPTTCQQIISTCYLLACLAPVTVLASARDAWQSVRSARHAAQRSRGGVPIFAPRGRVAETFGRVGLWEMRASP
jgi:hypothetical protein